MFPSGDVLFQFNFSTSLRIRGTPIASSTTLGVPHRSALKLTKKIENHDKRGVRTHLEY